MLPNQGMKLTKEPVTSLACAPAAPEPLRSLPRRWAASGSPRLRTIEVGYLAREPSRANQRDVI